MTEMDIRELIARSTWRVVGPWAQSKRAFDDLSELDQTSLIELGGTIVIALADLVDGDMEAALDRFAASLFEYRDVFGIQTSEGQAASARARRQLLALIVVRRQFDFVYVVQAGYQKDLQFAFSTRDRADEHADRMNRELADRNSENAFDLADVQEWRVDSTLSTREQQRWPVRQVNATEKWAIERYRKAAVAAHKTATNPDAPNLRRTVADHDLTVAYNELAALMQRHEITDEHVERAARKLSEFEGVTPHLWDEPPPVAAWRKTQALFRDRARAVLAAAYGEDAA